jgi:alpha-N-arabinofuranosidase
MFQTILFFGLAQNNKAIFSYFEYKGNDTFFSQKLNSKNQTYNPILPGMYPDPSICKRGKDYFLINSSFSYFPGIPIFHSTDLIHWKQIGHVLDQFLQLKLDGLGISGGVYAPSITYNENTQTFYVVNTVVGGIGNYYVTTKDPFKGWSMPIKLPEVKGIDPSFFVDDDGAGYILSSQASDKPRWTGHTVIWIHSFDFEKGKVSKDRQILMDGGSDTASHPRWLEGPHIFKVNGYYYLLAAEGGTLSGHKELVFRSKDVKGPYNPSPNNPILTQIDLPSNRNNKITNVGHADMVQDSKGNWFTVFLGTRPYADEQFNTGRETFILPVKWVDGFPIILEKGMQVPTVVSFNSTASINGLLTGNFTWKDEFNSKKLDLNWNTVRTPYNQWWNLKNGKMEIDLLPKSLSQLVNPAFLGRRQQHQNFEATTVLDFTPTKENEFAGLAYFQNEKNYLTLGKILKGGKSMIIVRSIVNGKDSIVSIKEINKVNSTNKIALSISVKEGLASFYFKTKGSKVLLVEHVDVTNLSTKKAKGFVGAYIGLYATSLVY